MATRMESSRGSSSRTILTSGTNRRERPLSSSSSGRSSRTRDHSRGQARRERRGEPVAEKPVAVCPSTGTPETFRHHHNPHLFPAQPTRRHLGNPRNLLRFVSLSWNKASWCGGRKVLGRVPIAPRERERGVQPPAREKDKVEPHRQPRDLRVSGWVSGLDLGELAETTDGTARAWSRQFSPLRHETPDDSASRLQGGARASSSGSGTGRARSPPDSRGRGGRDGPGAAGSRLLARLAVPDSDGSTLDRVLAAEGAPACGSQVVSDPPGAG